MINVRKQAAFFGAILLFFQAVPLSLTQVYAETDDAVDPQLVKAFRSYEPEYLNLNQSMISSESETEAVQEFSFVEKTFRTTVGQPVLLRFTSALPANEVLLRIPDNGQIVEEAFSNGEAIRHSHGEYWLLKTSKHQNEFVLPVVFEEAGQYFLTVDHDADHFYLEIEEGRADTDTIETEVLEVPDLIEQAELSLEDHQQETQEVESEIEMPIAIRPIMATENNLSISEEMIAAEEARILEVITDPQNKSLSTVNSWSQFRSAWNSSSTTEIRTHGNIIYSGGLFSSLNVRSNSVTLTNTRSNSVSLTNTANLRAGNDQLFVGEEQLRLSSSANLTIVSSMIWGTSKRGQYTIDHSGTGKVTLTNNTLDDSTQLSIQARNIVIESGSRVRGNVNLLNQGTLEILSKDSTRLTGIDGGDTADTELQTTGSGHNIYIKGNNFLVRERAPLSRIATWNTVDLNLSGGSTTQINSAITSPDDFSIRYFGLTGSRRSILLNATASDGWVDPPKPSYLLSLIASPSEGGTPRSNTASVNQDSTTSIRANPNEGYRFVKWEIVSGTNARVANETAESTTFTMGSSDAVVRAVYEENTYSLSLQASPAEGGSPSADEDTLIAQEETVIHASPNEGYRFVSWKILSGTGAKIADATAEMTTFTMGSSDVVLQANYEEEATDVRPLDPLDPEKEVNPENPPVLPEEQGLFSIDFASRFDFGVQAISAQGQTYYAKPQRLMAEDGTVLEGEERPNYVQISDQRSAKERDGWELSVRQNEQFHTDTGQELTGARLILQNQQIATAQGGIEPGLQHTNPMPLIPGGAKRTLLKAQGPEGEGTWIYRFGNAETAAQSVALEVPNGATPTVDHYKTTLTWELTSVPKN